MNKELCGDIAEYVVRNTTWADYGTEEQILIWLFIKSCQVIESCQVTKSSQVIESCQIIKFDSLSDLIV
jgi:hypothetical protein